MFISPEDLRAKAASLVANRGGSPNTIYAELARLLIDAAETIETLEEENIDLSDCYDRCLEGD